MQTLFIVAMDRSCKISHLFQLLSGLHFMRKPLILLFSLAFINNIASAGDSVAIEPGMWEVTTTMTSPMSNQPQVETSQECMEQSEISAEDLTPSEDDSCSTSEVSASGDTLTWSMQCSMQGGSMSGGGTFTSEGDTGHGKMHMDMNIQGGQSMKMEMSWKGKRIGSC